MEVNLFIILVPVDQIRDRRGVEGRHPTVNLERYNIKASPLKERSVPIIVPHVLELIVGTRTKRVQFLQRIQIIILIREHKYMCRGKILLGEVKSLPPPPR